MERRIVRGVRVATPSGIRPASVHIVDGIIAAVAGYDEVPRLAQPQELGKSVLMPGLVQGWPGALGSEDSRSAAAGGITTILTPSATAGAWVDEAAMPIEDERPRDLRWRLAEFWTAARERDESIESVMETLARVPAAAAGLAARKGQIAAGCDADFVIWNPELTVVGKTPLLYGPVRETLLRGATIFKDGRLIGEASGQRADAST